MKKHIIRVVLLVILLVGVSTMATTPVYAEDTKTVTATVTWQDASFSSGTSVYLQLYRATEAEPTPVPVLGADWKYVNDKVEYGSLNASNKYRKSADFEWPNQPVRDQESNIYTYSVQQIDNNGKLIAKPYADNLSSGSHMYAYISGFFRVTNSGLNITNEFIDRLSVSQDWTSYATPTVSEIYVRPFVYEPVDAESEGVSSLFAGGNTDIMARAQTLIRDKVLTPVADATPQRVELPCETWGPGFVDCKQVLEWSGLPHYCARGLDYPASMCLYVALPTDSAGNLLNIADYIVTIPYANNTGNDTFWQRLKYDYFAVGQRTVTAHKVWVGGSKPEVGLTLYRDGQQVSDQDVCTLQPGQADCVWQQLPIRDKYNHIYTYTAQELAVPDNYIATYSEDGLTVTNTYTSPKTDVTARKVWHDAHLNHPSISLQLLRNGQPYGAAVTVGSDGAYTWNTLDKTDSNGVQYVYSVVEPTVPEHYVASYSADGMTVTNTYVPPKIDITMQKLWSDNLTIHPVIAVQLFRNGQPFGDGVTLNGAVTYTWKNIDKTNMAGVDYVYTVDEISTPASYKKTVSGMTITNTYTAPAVTPPVVVPVVPSTPPSADTGHVLGETTTTPVPATIAASIATPAISTTAADANNATTLANTGNGGASQIVFVVAASLMLCAYTVFMCRRQSYPTA